VNGVTNYGGVAKVFSVDDMLDLLVVHHRGRGTPLCHLDLVEITLRLSPFVLSPMRNV